MFYGLVKSLRGTVLLNELYSHVLFVLSLVNKLSWPMLTGNRNDFQIIRLNFKTNMYTYGIKYVLYAQVLLGLKKKIFADKM